MLIVRFAQCGGFITVGLKKNLRLRHQSTEQPSEQSERQPEKKGGFEHGKEKETQPIPKSNQRSKASSMIKQALFHQPWITGEEPDDPQIEINECVTSQIKDMPKEIQDRVEAYTGSRRTTQKRFNIANKGSRS